MRPTRTRFVPALPLLGLAILAACPDEQAPADDDDDASLPLDFDGDGWTAGEDCDDSDASINPGAAENCASPWDDDCDSDANDPDALGCVPLWADSDHDGFGDPSATSCMCAEQEPFSASQAGDCDDADPDVNPDALEQENGVDDDCDGDLDEGVLHDDDIQWIWDIHCLLCHIEGGYGTGLVLVDAWDQLVGVPSDQVPSMDLVEPGETQQSYLWHKLSGTFLQVGGSGQPMPYASALPPDQLAVVQAWIEGGALR